MDGGEAKGCTDVWGGGNSGKGRWRRSEVRRVIEGWEIYMEQCKEMFRKGQGLGMGYGRGKSRVERRKMEEERGRTREGQEEVVASRIRSGGK